MGDLSNLKSPVWINRPEGVTIAKALLSGMECETGTKETSKGPAVTWLGQQDAQIVQGDIQIKGFRVVEDDTRDNGEQAAG